jgi:hypothetical protein
LLDNSPELFRNPGNRKPFVEVNIDCQTDKYAPYGKQNEFYLGFSHGNLPLVSFSIKLAASANSGGAEP